MEDIADRFHSNALPNYLNNRHFLPFKMATSLSEESTVHTSILSTLKYGELWLS